MNLIPDEFTGFFSSSNPSSCIMALQLTQPLRGMHSRNPPGGKVWLVYKADNLNTTCEPTEQKMWVPQCLLQPYGPPQPFIGTALPFFFLSFQYKKTDTVTEDSTFQTLPTSPSNTDVRVKILEPILVFS
jgi:hypothetical protein